jgi:hypothetical protein
VYEDMGWLYLGQDGSVRIRAGVSRSGYGCEGMGRLHRGQVSGCEIFGWLVLGQDGLCVYGLTVSMSGYRYVNMGSLYVGQNKGMNVWAGCI